MSIVNQHPVLPLSQFVREKRKESGLTQQGLADKAGVGLRFVRELERDKPSLQMDKVNQVLLLFGYELGPLPINRNKLIHAKG
jgi:y4mF family transcriptional regulator